MSSQSAEEPSWREDGRNRDAAKSLLGRHVGCVVEFKQPRRGPLALLARTRKPRGAKG